MNKQMKKNKEKDYIANAGILRLSRFILQNDKNHNVRSTMRRVFV